MMKRTRYVIALIVMRTLGFGIRLEIWAQPPADAKPTVATAAAVTDPIVDTGQAGCYDNISEIVCPQTGAAFSGQDAQYQGRQLAYKDNGDGTVTDNSTGLTWMQADSGKGMAWAEALSYCESLELAGQSDWRLPDAKELQSLVDYRRSPATTQSAAIDPLFKTSAITDEGGKTNYPFYWTSTSHANQRGTGSAVYISFGEALGWMKAPQGNQYTLMDVHGAGAQRPENRRRQRISSRTRPAGRRDPRQ